MFSKDQDQSCQDLNVPDLLIRSHLNVKQDKGLSGVPCNHALFPQAVKSNRIKYNYCTSCTMLLKVYFFYGNIEKRTLDFKSVYFYRDNWRDRKMSDEKFDATKYKNDFQKEKYDRIIVNVPKGQKQIDV